MNSSSFVTNYEFLIHVVKEKESDQFTRKHVKQASARPSRVWWYSDEKPQVCKKKKKMLKKKKKNPENLIPKLKIQILYLILTFLKGSGSFQVLGKLGCLTAAPPQSLGLISVFC